MIRELRPKLLLHEWAPGGTARCRDRAYPNMIEEVRFAVDSLLEGDGFEPSVPRVMEVDLGRQVPALIAVFELAGTAVTSQRGTKCQRRTV